MYALCSTNWAEWAAFTAELVVAWVIYLEWREHRATQALEIIWDRALYDKRRKLYEEFTALGKKDLEMMQNEFLEKLQKDPQLRENCDAQITGFDKLGYILRPRGLEGLFRRLVRRPYQSGDMVETFSHVVVALGLMLVPYVRLRRERKGRHWARHFLGLTMAGIRFISRSGLTLFATAPKTGTITDVVFNQADLEQLEAEIKAL